MQQLQATPVLPDRGYAGSNLPDRHQVGDLNLDNMVGVDGPPVTALETGIWLSEQECVAALSLEIMDPEDFEGLDAELTRRLVAHAVVLFGMTGIQGEIENLRKHGQDPDVVLHAARCSELVRAAFGEGMR